MANFFLACRICLCIPAAFRASPVWLLLHSPSQQKCSGCLCASPISTAFHPTCQYKTFSLCKVSSDCSRCYERGPCLCSETSSVHYCPLLWLCSLASVLFLSPFVFHEWEQLCADHGGAPFTTVLSLPPGAAASELPEGHQVVWIPLFSVLVEVGWQILSLFCIIIFLHTKAIVFVPTDLQRL